MFICYRSSANQGSPPNTSKNVIYYPSPRNEYTNHRHLLLGYYLRDSDLSLISCNLLPIDNKLIATFDVMDPTLQLKYC
jgi:hypothetical protein